MSPVAESFAVAAAKYAAAAAVSWGLDRRKRGKLKKAYSNSARRTIEYCEAQGHHGGSEVWNAVTDLLGNPDAAHDVANDFGRGAVTGSISRCPEAEPFIVWFVNELDQERRKLLPGDLRNLADILQDTIRDDTRKLARDHERMLEGVQQIKEAIERQGVAPGREREVAQRVEGALPPVWNVPHRRNPNFTGRDELLAELRAGLASGEPAAVTQAIAGLGGVGKTQLALEYAYRHMGDYETVWWVRSEEPAELAADYAALAEALDLREKDEPDQRVTIEAVRRWLERNGGWLLVFDNAREPDEVRQYLPRAATGHVTVTSRNPAWAGTATPLSVPVLKRTKSVEFLLKRTGQKDKKAARELADELGNLPLALEQAAAYMEATGRPMGEYVELFRERAAEVLKRGDPSEDYPYTVATTWEMACVQVEEACPAGADLLRLSAFLAPDDIPRDLLTEGAEHLPKRLATAVRDEIKFDGARAAAAALLPGGGG